MMADDCDYEEDRPATTVLSQTGEWQGGESSQADECIALTMALIMRMALQSGRLAATAGPQACVDMFHDMLLEM